MGVVDTSDVPRARASLRDTSDWSQCMRGEPEFLEHGSNEQSRDVIELFSRIRDHPRTRQNHHQALVRHRTQEDCAEDQMHAVLDDTDAIKQDAERVVGIHCLMRYERACAETSQQQSHMLSYLSSEMRVRKDHPLRPIRTMVEQEFERFSQGLDAMYAPVGRVNRALRWFQS